MGYELLFKVGDDPLQELVEMDRFFKWSYRIRKLRGILYPKRSISPLLIYFVAIAFAFSLGIFTVYAFEYLFG